MTVIDQYGVQRFPYNSAYKWMLDRERLDLNRMGIAYQREQITFDDYLDFYLNIGYSVSGFAGLDAFEHLEIDNPLWR